MFIAIHNPYLSDECASVALSVAGGIKSDARVGVMFIVVQLRDS